MGALLQDNVRIRGDPLVPMSKTSRVLTYGRSRLSGGAGVGTQEHHVVTPRRFLLRRASRVSWYAGEFEPPRPASRRPTNDGQRRQVSQATLATIWGA
jgi:hypothetical protein